MPSGVLLNSGGIDSRVVAAKLSSEGWRLDSLFVDWYPEVTVPASKAAQITADLYCETHDVFPWPVDWRTWFDKLDKLTVANTALLVHMVGGMYASHLGVTYVASGVRAEVTSDGTWLTQMSTLMGTDQLSPKHIYTAPLHDLTDDQVTDLTVEYDVDLTSTWSCMKANPACGTCNSCRRKIGQGFAV